ncbi:MAG: ABC transporter permease, partial [Prevotellaceae bacterium]|nr:ABC transporter permease [Prevotellaceae bacterium]
MIRQILKQMWNNRRSNAWIVAELILVTYFMWGVIDPVYTLLSNRAIPQGYSLHNVFSVSTRGFWFYTERDRAEREMQALEQALLLIRDYPGVEAASIGNMYPLSNVHFSKNLGNQDSTNMTNTRNYMFSQGGDFFKIFRINDIYTGELLPSTIYPEDGIYLSEDAAHRIFPHETSYVGRRVYENDTTSYTVAGIFPPLKQENMSGQPTPVFITVAASKLGDSFFSNSIVFRIRDDLSPTVFAAQF